MTSEATSKRQLKIKSGVVNRLFKEQNMYQNETIDLRTCVDKFVQDDAEAWDIKNGNNMLAESHKVLEETTTRLGNAVAELQELVTSIEKEKNLVGDEDLLRAKETLQRVQTAVNEE
ncbi:hypothetical protein EW145_g965 [Phellinidium pouzarii]|uniref:Tubulin-specific chaperone A n=1 Tax=Phellinidium pouzarii TaxID=167371 RepID=A0A4V3XDT8_9AGAM|nr:hypothetical protein EW145_g965 [Phellinidium pouzarii]